MTDLIPTEALSSDSKQQRPPNGAMSDGKNAQTPKPGDGLRSLRSTMLFRAINYELYVKPNAVIMALGIVAMTGCAGYIYYMRSKYEGMGYYSAIETDGKETFKKRTSKWDD